MTFNIYISNSVLRLFRNKTKNPTQVHRKLKNKQGKYFMQLSTAMKRIMQEKMKATNVQYQIIQILLVKNWKSFA